MSFLYFLYRSFPNRDWRTGLLKALSFGGELFAYWRCRRTPPHAVLLYWVHYSVVKRQQCTTVVVVWCPSKSQWDVKCITLYDCSLRNQNYSWSSHVSSHLIKEPANNLLDVRLYSHDWLKQHLLLSRFHSGSADYLKHNPFQWSFWNQSY